MGLAGPINRRKIGKDPNNTNWADNESSFGRKILSAQGWTPGSYLGAKDAAHSDHFSAASASHIRVLMKEDTLGLGAKRSRTDDSSFGLFALQDIYGRLNGKSEVELVKEQVNRADLGRKLYAEQRWGSSRFVRGGFLVGDKVEDLKPDMIRLNPASLQTSEEEGQDGSEKTAAQSTSEPKNPRVKTKKQKEQKHTPWTDAATLNEATYSATSVDVSRLEAKEERRRKKLERRQRKADKRAGRDAEKFAENGQTAVEEISDAPDVEAASISPMLSSQSQPALQSPAFNARNSVRSRFIKQKRMASMDPQALREILMLKG